MNRLKPIVAMLMLTLFAFASSHPLLEGLGLIHQAGTHTEGPASPDSDHALADGKCQFNSSRVEIQKFFANGGFNLVELRALAIVLQLEDLSSRPSVEIAGLPLPELGTSWQFSFRTALPARAPSLIS